ncbi:MAG: DUF2059 domain-containing protein [Rubricella sp.]
MRHGIGLVLAMALIAPPLAARAQSEDALRITDALVTEELFVAAFESQRALVSQLLVSQAGPGQLTMEQADQMMDVIVQEMSAEFVVRMRQEMALEHDALLSAADLAAIADFLDTPAGQAWAAVNPELTIRGARIGERIGQEIAVQILPQVIARLMQEGTFAPAPAPMPGDTK